jgi:hypothetical protein
VNLLLIERDLDFSYMKTHKLVWQVNCYKKESMAVTVMILWNQKSVLIYRPIVLNLSSTESIQGKSVSTDTIYDTLIFMFRESPANRLNLLEKRCLMIFAQLSWGLMLLWRSLNIRVSRHTFHWKRGCLIGKRVLICIKNFVFNLDLKKQLTVDRWSFPHSSLAHYNTCNWKWIVKFIWKMLWSGY